MVARSNDTEFQITVHRPERIIEVRYPARPNRASLDRYAQAIREAIRSMNGTWKCLVDQSALLVVPPELTLPIAELNRWAMDHGMEITARVVRPSAISEMQARRIFREGGLEDRASLYTSRDEAWRSLSAPSNRLPDP
ncbi:MAG: STAS/SEC14 domain-containing protein [Myxococcaceae bacterium]|nr:STAS/SEC14 domain-containing protein [Myxococcaceae bacterium]